jgi:hypothetical protein
MTILNNWAMHDRWVSYGSGGLAQDRSHYLIITQHNSNFQLRHVYKFKQWKIQSRNVHEHSFH